MINKKRILICMCSNRPHTPDFSLSLIALYQHETAKRLKGEALYEIGTSFRENSSLLPWSRQQTFKDSGQKGATDCLLIDDDIKFPPDALECLVAHGKDIVGANYVKKECGRLEYTALDEQGGELTSHDKNGIQKVGRLGMGFLLINLSILDGIPPPHFEVLGKDGTEDYDGEDHYFCNKLRSNGIDIYVDHDLSNRIGHVGKCVYTPELYLALKDKAYLLANN